MPTAAAKKAAVRAALDRATGKGNKPVSVRDVQEQSKRQSPRGTTGFATGRSRQAPTKDWLRFHDESLKKGYKTKEYAPRKNEYTFDTGTEVPSHKNARNKSRSDRPGQAPRLNYGGGRTAARPKR